MTFLSRLVEFWSRHDSTGRDAHPDDRPSLHPLRAELDQHGIALDLFPQPWVGPILRARAFVLQLNPGLSGPERKIEQEDRDFRDALVRNLRGLEPNLFLDPRFAAHPGRTWVERRLRGIAPVDVLRTSLAQIELFPYHSKRFSSIPARLRRALLDLPSVRVVRRAVHEDLLSRAARGEITIVALRSRKEWDLENVEESPSLIVYRGWEAQNGYCTPATRGGRALQARLTGSVSRSAEAQGP